MKALRQCRFLAVGLAGMLALGACGGGGGDGVPTDINDPVALEADLGEVDAALASTQFSSFQSLTYLFDLGGIGAAPPAMARAKLLLDAAKLQMPDLKNPRATRVSARQTGALKALRAGAAANQGRVFAGPTIDPTNLGNTWVWDELNDQYVEQVGGGPVNGARFELYAIDPFTDLPVEPVSVVGYVDIIDLGTASLTGLQVVVVGGTTTYADYTVSAVVGQTSFTAGTSGFVTDGTQRIDFAATATGDASSYSYDITQFDVSDPDIQFTLSYDESYTETATTYSGLIDFTFTIVYQGQTVRVDGTNTYDYDSDTDTDVETEDVTVRVGGDLYASLHYHYDGGIEEYTLTDADGNDLAGEQLAVVESIYEAPDVVLGMLYDITEAAFQVLGIY